MDIKDMDRQYIANTYARSDVLFTHGRGALLYDENGRAYIDLGGGIAVNTFGIADASWAEAVKEQIDTLQHTSNLYFTQPQAELAQLLCERTGMHKVFFSNSGAEANECAIKTARKYSSDRYGSARGTVITLNGSFHGRTVATLSATGQEQFHQHFFPFCPGFVHVQPGDIAALEHALDKHSCCAVMMELIQGEGGLNVLDTSYVQKAAELAGERDVLLIIDEVQTGNGRTGSLYAFTQYGITPDIVSTAKGLAGGLPFGATLLGEKVSETLSAGSHGSTFGGNPVAAAGAYNILSRLDGTLLAEVRKKGEWIYNALQDASGVETICGMGLMLGIQTKQPPAQIAKNALAEGLVVLTAKDKVRLLPPLNIPMELLERGIEILRSVLAQGD